MKHVLDCVQTNALTRLPRGPDFAGARSLTRLSDQASSGPRRLAPSGRGKDFTSVQHRLRAPGRLCKAVS